MHADSQETKRLGDVVALSREKAVGNKLKAWPYIGLEHFKPGSPRLVGSAPSETSSSTNNVFHPGDILFGKLRPYLRKCVAAPFDGYCSTDILVLRAQESIDPGFAAKLMASEPVFAEAAAKSFGTKMPRASWATLRELRVFSPPLPEQRRIAEILDTLDEAIRKTEQVIAKLQQMKQGLLHDLLTRGIDENGELRDPERYPEQFRDTELGRIPREWEVVRLEHACTRIVDCPHSTPHYRDAGLLVARTMHIRDGRYDATASSRVSRQEYRQRISRLEPQPGDVIFTREAPVGEAFCIPEGMKICLGQRVMVLRPRPEKLAGEYLVNQIYSGSVKSRIGVLTGGTTNPHLNVASVRTLPLPTPPIAEQHEIVRRSRALELRLSAEECLRRKLEATKTGLADDLLTGRVRVGT